MPATASSRFEYWNGTIWVQEKNVLSIHIKDELHHPTYCEVQISNYGTSGDVDDDANVKENIFTEYQKVRVIEGNTGAPLFIGKITKVAPGYDGGLGQQVTVHAWGGFLELQSRLVDRNIKYSGNKKISQIVKDLVVGSGTIGNTAEEANYVQSHSFSGNINFDGNGLATGGGPETQQLKFRPSDITQDQGNRKKHLEGAGKNALRVIQMLSSNDKDSDEDNMGWDFYLDAGFSDASAFANGTGTISSNTITVTGSGTTFTTQLTKGDHIAAIVGGGYQYREIVDIESNTVLTLGHAFSSNVSSGTAFTYRSRMTNPSPYMHYFKRGYEPGKLPGEGYAGTYGLTFRHQGYGYGVSTVVVGTGTISTSGTTVTGSSTTFTGFTVGQRIAILVNSVYEFRTITSIVDNEELNVDAAFSINAGSGSSYGYTEARVMEESDYHNRTITSKPTYPVRSVRPNFSFPRAYEEIKTKVRTSFQLEDDLKRTARHQQFDAILINLYKNTSFTLPKVDENDGDDVAQYEHKPYITWTGTDGAGTARVLYCSKAGSAANQKKLDIDGAGAGAAADKYSGYIVIGPRYVDNDGRAVTDDTWLRQISGQTITFTHSGGSGNDVPSFSSFTAIANPVVTIDEDGYPEPGSMRELIEQDVEVKLNEYDKTALKDAAEKAAQILYQGGKRTIRGTLNIQKWPYYIITGRNTGTSNTTCTLDNNAALLSRGVFAGGIFYNKGNGGNKNISATIKINGVTNTTVAGDASTYMDWQNNDVYEIPVLMRAGQIIEVSNFPVGTGIKTQDSVITKIEYDESTGYQEARIDTMLFKQTRGWGGSPVPNRSLANAIQDGGWETAGRTGSVPLADQSWGAYITLAAVDHDTVQWYGSGSGQNGTIKFSKGASYTISPGNSGNKTDPFVIYFDADASETVLQTATIGTEIDNYIGSNKITLAQCIPTSSGGSCEIIADPRVKGFSITTAPASDSVGAELLKKSARPWVTDLQIKGTAYNAIAWGASVTSGNPSATATINFSDGTDTLTITGGTATGISAGTYYIYVDFASSTTNLTLVTNNTTRTTAQGDTKILLAIMVVSASADGTAPLILPFNSKELTISAVALAADSITAGHIASGTIETGNINFVASDIGGVTNGNVIATINASSETGTLRIDANRVHISGDVTFSSLTLDPREKTKTFTTGSTSSPPTSQNTGDVWINPTNSDVYIASAANVNSIGTSSGWVLKAEPGTAKDNAATAEQNAQIGITERSRVFRQGTYTGGSSSSGVPANARIRDIWIDSNHQILSAMATGTNLQWDDWALTDHASAINEATTKINGGLIDTQRIRLLKGGGSNTALETRTATWISTGRIGTSINGSQTYMDITARSGSNLYVSVGDVLSWTSNGSGELVYVDDVEIGGGSGSNDRLTIIRSWLGTSNTSHGYTSPMYKMEYIADHINEAHIIMDNNGITGLSSYDNVQFRIRATDGSAEFGEETVKCDANGITFNESNANNIFTSHLHFKQEGTNVWHLGSQRYQTSPTIDIGFLKMETDKVFMYWASGGDAGCFRPANSSIFFGGTDYPWGKVFTQSLALKEVSSMAGLSNQDASHGQLYAKTDGYMYFKRGGYTEAIVCTGDMDLPGEGLMLDSGGDTSGTYKMRGIRIGSESNLSINGSWYLRRVSSSLTWKDNPRSIEIDTSKVLTLTPKTFTWKDIEGIGDEIRGKDDFGLIAEEVHEILPELVTYDENGDPSGLRYQMINILLLEEVKKLKERIEVLEGN